MPIIKTSDSTPGYQRSDGTWVPGIGETYREESSADRLEKVVIENKDNGHHKRNLNWKLLLGLKEPLI